MNNTKRLVFAILALLSITTVSGQTASFTKQAFKGFPSPEGTIDIRQGFANPPKGYGNVPFYWWPGDSLKMERLRYELELLADSPTDGFSISYNHTHHDVDLEANAGGYGFCGVADYGYPRAFSDDWWNIWNEFSGLCADRNLGVGMDDYVFAVEGNHDFMDAARNSPEFEDYQGVIECGVFAPGKLPANVLLTEPAHKDSLKVYYTSASPDLHPGFGKKVVQLYFQAFEDHMDERGRQGMNYFFQDELSYNPTLCSWCEDMPEQFKARKGYDIIPHVPALFEDRGDESIKVRLDYADVVADLAEERFFKPVYDWHSSRGLIYGCDNEGRGLDPTRYMDYFRQMSWFSAPGNDAPARGSSFTQTKVSSSVTHLYERPRTWLEAFHSMGWDANGAVLTHQLDHHIIAGGNLLCMHGLYYSTHGSWWEWAPPSFHFRMPYWPHMKKWLSYAERLCFVLSQGRHVCDVAILYPTETMQAIPGTGFDFCNDVSLALSEAGIDFDFIDYKSLQRASSEGGVLSVAGESYKVLVLAGIQAMHEETAAAIARFEAAGGLVVRTSDDTRAAVDFVNSHIVRDFVPQCGEGRVLHRRVAENDVYMVMDIAKGSEIFLRNHGKAELWDAMSGSICTLPVLRTDADGSWLRFDGEPGSSQLIVFSPGEPLFAADAVAEAVPLETISLDGEWNVRLVPTMDNRWGDFRLPASNEFIGVEARSMDCSYVSSDGVSETGAAVFGYGPYMLTSNGDDQSWKPYGWSWQYGVYDSPGSQGYHGLKAKVDRRFLILDQGCDQYFKTRVFAPSTGRFKVLVEGTEPSIMKIDGKAVARDAVRLTKGWHELYLKYASTPKADYELERLVCFTIDKRERSMVMLLPEGSAIPEDYGLYDSMVASCWYGSDCLRFNPYPDGTWMYGFETAPGTVSMSTIVNGKVKKVLLDGSEVPFTQDGQAVSVNIARVNPRVSRVTVIASPDEFSPGAAFFAAPVKMSCSGGVMPAGDWTLQGAMRYYSGGVEYSRKLALDDCSGKWILDLGEVDATCEVWVNGNKVDELLSIPYSVDVSAHLRVGENTIKVLVYSSLANHYQTIPTPYRGTPHAGLCGPVSLIRQ